MEFSVFDTRYNIFEGKKCSLLEGGHFLRIIGHKYQFAGKTAQVIKESLF
jgi:hypothetical protein